MKITESKLRRIIRSIIVETKLKESVQMAEELADTFGELGINDESDLLSQVGLTESFRRRYGISEGTTESREVSRFERKVKDKMEQISQKFENLPPEKQENITEAIIELKARKSVGFFETVKYILMQLGLSLLWAIPLICLIVVFADIDTTWVQSQFPMLYNFLSHEMTFITSINLLMFGTAEIQGNEAGFHKAKMQQNQDRIDYLSKQ
tara:strand:+ start:6599 stop:7225 length:627 start_codon:yes stop_codon:yes gene_type:complete